MVPRGGMHFFYNLNSLAPSGTQNDSLKSLGFFAKSPTVFADMGLGENSAKIGKQDVQNWWTAPYDHRTRMA
jgi:hypothetical protein